MPVHLWDIMRKLDKADKILVGIARKSGTNVLRKLGDKQLKHLKEVPQNPLDVVKFP